MLIIPPLNCLAAACVGAVLHRRRVGRVLLWAGLGGLIVFAMPLVSGTLLSGLERGFSTTPAPGDMPGAIVILSGDEADVLEGGVSTTMVGPSDFGARAGGGGAGAAHQFAGAGHGRRGRYG